MRLNKIKLAGFKSFVDPTSIAFPSNLLGIVGPNGCGKSNVIDAVRWVMGESSAKHLRGDSMADVIFNGSSTRQPVGTASIELVFDNSDGIVGGQYARYSEIAIKRVVSRDGVSQYYLNNAKCRRKDITHIFLGTGLGSRSYAIIEQGMISRLIEAKPDDMRAHLEEAAGISKYKERRRETENRIRHTRENLERLNDLREEVENQIRHLQRQARTAERYKQYKQQERRMVAELLALKLIEMQGLLAGRERLCRERETGLQGAVAGLRSVEAQIETLRDSHNDATEAFNEVQSRYYRVGAEMARLEQSIQHTRELRERQSHELQDAEQALADIQAHIDRDANELEELTEALQSLEPELQQMRAEEERSTLRLSQAEQALAEWRDRWSGYTERVGTARQTAEVESARIERLNAERDRYAERRERVSGNLEGVVLEEVQRECTTLEAEAGNQQESLERLERLLEQVASALEAQRTAETERTTMLDQLKADLEKASARLASLETLQSVALGRDGSAVTQWLAGNAMEGCARLVEQVQVEPGWERAVETALGNYLEAVCVPQLTGLESLLKDLPDASLALVENVDQREHQERSGAIASLADKITGHGLARELLRDVATAANLPEALRSRATLQGHQSVITPEGIWLGRNWVRVLREQDEHAGLLSREAELRNLRPEVLKLQQNVEQAATSLADARDNIRRLEERRDGVQGQVNAAHRSLAETRARLQSAASRLEQRQAQRAAMRAELGEVGRHLQELSQGLETATARANDARRELERLEGEREGLCVEQDRLQAAHDEARQIAETIRKTAREVEIKVESRRSSQTSANQNLERMKTQLDRFHGRREQLKAQLSAGAAPLAEQEQELSGKVEQRGDVEKELTAARQKLGEVDAGLRELNLSRGEREREVDEAREALDSAKLAAQEVRVRSEALMEQLEDTQFRFDELKAELPEDAGIGAWEERLDNLRRRIDRLGPINLAAIEEFKEQSERKEYLDSQYNDLIQALETLENAIRKIDRETRTRFRETFDKVNAGLKELFPRLFGGGHAYLELCGDDLLEAGVTVMARPPGKRNSSIHLLSGGEKALTAVALVFAIFRLNPAPFCLLDEVDAPLDDANVGRFCDIVREMSGKVQFVFITHNKVTMEMAHQLTGVTMQEPGVSRLVAVDVDEAVRMAAG